MVRAQVVSALLLLTTACASPVATVEKQQPVNLCIAAAKQLLALFDFDTGTLAERCECTQRRRGGMLPDDAADWHMTGKFSPGLTLLQCSRSDIVGFYANAALSSAGPGLTARGLSIHQMRDFSVCVGEGAYEEMRRGAGSDHGDTGGLDQDGFRKMYGSCEAAAR